MTVAKALRNMTDEELAAYRADLDEKKAAIRDLQNDAENERVLREAMKGLPEGVRKLALGGHVRPEGNSEGSTES